MEKLRSEWPVKYDRLFSLIMANDHLFSLIMANDHLFSLIIENHRLLSLIVANDRKYFHSQWRMTVYFYSLWKMTVYFHSYNLNSDCSEFRFELMLRVSMSHFKIISHLNLFTQKRVLLRITKQGSRSKNRSHGRAVR